MNLKKLMSNLVCIACAIVLASCSKSSEPGDYDAAEVGKVKKVISGTILSMREVRLHNKSAESLSSAEAVDSDSSTSRSHGFEYVIRLNSGGIISVVQADDVKLKPKQHVLVIYGENTRVVADNGSEKF